jgi:hypothetical protein
MVATMFQSPSPRNLPNHARISINRELSVREVQRQLLFIIHLFIYLVGLILVLDSGRNLPTLYLVLEDIVDLPSSIRVPKYPLTAAAGILLSE